MGKIIKFPTYDYNFEVEAVVEIPWHIMNMLTEDEIDRINELLDHCMEETEQCLKEELKNIFNARKKN